MARMPMHAAQTPAEEPRFEGTALSEIRPPGPVKCVTLALNDHDLSVLKRCAEGSSLQLAIQSAASLQEVRGILRAREAHLVLVGGSPRTGASTSVAALSEQARTLGVPVLMVADSVSDADFAAALRAGVTDVFAVDDLHAEFLDQAVESALARVRGVAADQLAMISNLRAENETLRRVAIRNMRLLKGQTLPLMSLAWRMMQGDQIREEDRGRQARRLARATRNVAGLIDDTVIVAATHQTNDVDCAVDLHLLLECILRDDLGEIANSRAHVVVHPLPILHVRESHMQMLLEELLLTAVRNSRVGRVPEIEIGSGADDNGNPVIWMLEKGLQLSARKQSIARRSELMAHDASVDERDIHAWSLCQRLVERNNGQFQISEVTEDTSRITMRFPRRLQVRPAAPPR